MRLSLIGPVFPYRGGIAHFTTLLARKLIDQGHDIQVVSFKQQYPAWLYPGESDKDYSPGREKVDADYLLTPLNPIRWRKTLQAILKFNPQEVIFPWWVTIWGPAFGYIAKRLRKRGIPVAFLIHNTIPHEARFFDKYLAKCALKHANRFIVMTEKEQRRLLVLLPEAKTIDVAPLPIYHAFKPAPLTKDEGRQRLHLSAEAPVLFYFGFVRPYKGLRFLIDALKIVNETGKEAHLVIVGEFWEDKGPYLAQIQALGLRDHVHIYDRYIPDDEIAIFFNVVDVFVAPYIDGTQSAALKAALGFGLPVVVTDVITDEMVDALPGRCKVVKAGDAAALAAGILVQIETPVQSSIEIAEVVEASWASMLAVMDKNQ